jgi:hypothetical protein
MKPEFQVQLASYPNLERLAAEVIVDNEMLADITYEKNDPELTLWPRQDGEPWRLPSEAVVAALSEADSALRERYRA